MKQIKKQHWWIIGGVAVTVTLGMYLLWRKSQKKARPSLLSTNTHTPPTKDKNAGPLASTVTEPNWNGPFDMKYEEDVSRWVAPKKIITLDSKQANRLAKKLKAAKGSWFADDDERAVQNVFARQLEDKVQVANLSRAFWELYKTDLWEHLNSFLSGSEMEAYVTKPVARLTNYRIA